MLFILNLLFSFDQVIVHNLFCREQGQPLVNFHLISWPEQVYLNILDWIYLYMYIISVSYFCEYCLVYFSMSELLKMELAFSSYEKNYVLEGTSSTCIPDILNCF